MKDLSAWAAEEGGALVCIAMSAVLYSVQSVLLKLLVAEGVSPPQAVALRAVVQGALVFASLKRRALPLLGPKGLKVWVTLRGLLGGTAFALLFHAASVLPVGDATTLYSLHPVATVFIARFFLGDPIRPATTAAALLTVGGSVMVAQPSFIFGADEDGSAANATGVEEGTPFLESRESGVVGALLVSVMSGFVICIIKYSRKADTAQQLWSWCCASACISTLLGTTVQPFTSSLSPRSVAYLSGICAVGMVGHFLVTHGARHAPSGPASLVRATEILHSYLWEVLFFSQSPPASTVVGVLLVCAALILVAAQQMKGGGKAGDPDDPAAIPEPEDLELHLCELDSVAPPGPEGAFFCDPEGCPRSPPSPLHPLQ